MSLDFRIGLGSSALPWPPADGDGVGALSATATAREGVAGDGGCAIDLLLPLAGGGGAGTAFGAGDAGGCFALASGLFFPGDGVANGLAHVGLVDLRPEPTGVITPTRGMIPAQCSVPQHARSHRSGCFPW